MALTGFFLLQDPPVNVRRVPARSLAWITKEKLLHGFSRIKGTDYTN
jgi:hypothetical protein